MRGQGRYKRDLPAGTTSTSNRPPTICPPSFVPVHTALFIRKTPAHREAFNPQGHCRRHGYSWPNGGRVAGESGGQCGRLCRADTFHNSKVTRLIWHKKTGLHRSKANTCGVKITPREYAEQEEEEEEVAAGNPSHACWHWKGHTPVLRMVSMDHLPLDFSVI